MKEIDIYREQVLQRSDVAIIVIPYSYFDGEVKKFNEKLIEHIDDKSKQLVDRLLKYEVYNVYICLYNIDSTRYRINMTEANEEVTAQTNVLINEVFKGLHNAYRKAFYAPTIQGKYFKTIRSLTKIVTDSNLFGNSKRNNIKYDARKEDPVFNETIKKLLEGKLDNVCCGVITDTFSSNNGDVLEEDVFDRALWDVITYTFLDKNKHFRIII